MDGDAMRHHPAIDYRITIRLALKMANQVEVLDPENLAGDMVLISLLAMRAGRINCPTRKSLHFARREAMARLLGRWDRRDDLRDELSDSEEQADERRFDEHVWSVRRLQQLWPDLTAVERESILTLLSGEGDTSDRRRRVVDNAKRRVLAMLRGEKKRDQKRVTCGRTGHFKRAQEAA